MEAWKQRVIDEHKDVSSKIERLERFIQGDGYKQVSAPEAARLRLQLNLMRSYRNGFK